MIKITDKKNCMGCYACENICPKHCIEMISDEEGFWYPSVNMEMCIECGLCEKVCTILKNHKKHKEPIAYACFNNNDDIRKNSSSGGIFTLLAQQIINNGGIVFGARFDDAFNVMHDGVEHIDDLHQFRGSKYVQSRIGDTYKRVKEKLSLEKEVLFSGTPCQIAGLKSYLQHDDNNLFCVDIICHGVPSPRVWQKYIQFQQNYFDSSISSINFRNKDNGWKKYSINIRFKNNKVYKRQLNDDLYMKAFLKNICLRPSCYQCAFKSLHRESDLTLADFWGIGNILPNLNDDKGTSLILINSEKGQKVFDNIKDKIIYENVDVNQAIIYNSAAIKSAKYNSNRNHFFSKLDKYNFDKLVNKYCKDRFLSRIKRNIYRLIRKFIKRKE